MPAQNKFQQQEKEMSVKELNTLIKCHRDMTFEQFCKEIYPDFHLKFSQPYLEGKYSRFQHHFMSFLKELDEQHLAYFANCLEKQYEQQKND